MCLDAITSLGPFQEEETIKYKVLSSLGSTIFYGKQEPLPIGKWLHSEDYFLQYEEDIQIEANPNRPTYPKGWHVFDHIESTEKFKLTDEIVMECKIKNIVAKGREFFSTPSFVTVAKQLFLIRKIS